MDERDGDGLEGGDNATSTDAKTKELFKIDLADATDISGMDGLTAATHAVNKTLFVNLVSVLTANGYAANQIPSKIEGVAIGSDVRHGAKTLHTLWISNDNDFLPSTGDAPPLPNPNQFFVFGFTDTDLAGSTLVPQFWEFR